MKKKIFLIGSLVAFYSVANAAINRNIQMETITGNVQTQDFTTAQDIDKGSLNRDLLHAARLGNFENIKKLIKAGANINARESMGEETALVYALKGNHKEIVKELIATPGIDVELGGGMSGTPLMIAIRLKYPPEIIKMLIKHGADVNYGSALSGSPLEIATRNNDKVIVEILKAHGAK